MAAPAKGFGLPLLPEQTAPATPPANYVAVYAKSDHKVYIKDSTGAETDITTAGAGGSTSFVSLAKWGTD